MLRPVLILAVLLVGLSACKDQSKTRSVSNDEKKKETALVVRQKVRIIRNMPHNSSHIYTQGFEIHDSILYESTGLKNESVLKKIDLKTGEIIKMVDVADIFGEGITLINNEIIMLSYRRGIALRFDPETLQEKGICFTYDTEGWGLSNNGNELIMSDGSDKLYFRDPFTYKIIRTLNVRKKGLPVYYLNELEYVKGEIYANIYGQEDIVVIDPNSGEVVRVIDASNLSCAQNQFDNPENVLNGIAYNPASETFYVTGKRCSDIYEVEFY